MALNKTCVVCGKSILGEYIVARVHEGRPAGSRNRWRTVGAVHERCEPLLEESMTDKAHKRKCWNCGNVAIHARSIVPEVLCTKCGSQDTRRIKSKDDVLCEDPDRDNHWKEDRKPEPKPSIKIISVFGESNIEVSDGVHSISLGLTRKGVEALISELQMVLNMADDPEDDPNEPDDDSCPRCGGSGQVVTEQFESYTGDNYKPCPKCGGKG